MYILSKDIDHLDYEDYKVQAEKYDRYLESIETDLNLSPSGFARADWYRSFESHKCPHDSWLDRLTISEDDNNEVQIELRLLGAYHDGFITFRYHDVQYYRLDRHQASITKSSHGDLRYEEFRLDDNGLLIHEYDWYNLDENALFLIACKKIEYQWEALAEGDAPKRKPCWRT